MSIANIFKKLNSRDTRILPSINTLTKIIFIALIAITATFFVKKILAVNNIIKQTQDAQTKGNNAESWQLNSWNTNSVNLLTTLTGAIPFNEDGSINESEYKLSGILGISTKMATAFYQPQASGVQYIAQVKDNFLGKSSYAQGVAFNKENSLQPLLPLWKILRNVVYALSSVVFIVIGIMIMLRVKISPQAVITIQNSIPKLITSLIMVTFSYAIAGLIIDISYWIQGFVIALLFSAKGVDFGSNLFDLKWVSLNIIDVIPLKFYSFNGLVNADFIKLSMLANSTVPAGSLLLLGGVVGQVVLGSIIGGATGLLGSAFSGGGNFIGGAIGWVVGAACGVVFMIILFIIVAIWLIKLFFGLLTAYVTIIIQIITAPVMIGIGAFPNSKIGFGSWLIDLISKVAVFPVVLIALIFINYLMEISSGSLWAPSLLNTGTGDNSRIIKAAIGLAGLALISKLPKLVPEAIFMLKPSAFGKAIGESFAGPAKWAKSTASSTAKAGIDYADQRYGDENKEGGKWQKTISFANRVLSGKTYRKRVDQNSITKDDEVV